MIQTTGDVVTQPGGGDVLLAPWLTNGTDTDLMAAGFQPGMTDMLAPAAPSTPDLNAGSDSLDPNATPLIGTNSDDITDINTPSFSGTAEANALVRLYDGLTQIGTTFANGAGNWSITSSLLADGVHSITATATDTAGNVSLPSPALSVTIDTLAPAVSTPDLNAGSDSLDPNATPLIGTNSDDITDNNTPSFSGTAEANALVRLYDGLTQIGTTFANGAGNWSITSSLLADGVHSITATATDTAGNVSLPSPALSVTIDTLAPAVSTPDLNAGSDSLDPNATPLIGTNSDDITDHNTPSFSGTAEANALVRLYDGLTQIGTTFANGAGNWSITSSLLADGVHSITATATDTAGNVSLPSPALSVTIDTLAPAVSTPDLDAGSDTLDPNATPLIGTNSDDITDHNTPSFSGTAEANALVRLYDGLTQIGTTFANGAGNWSITSSLLADGVHSITATATDTAGNVSLPSPALSVTIDTLAPAVSTPDLDAGSDTLDPNATPLIGTNSDDITDHNTPSFSGTAEANALVRLYDGLTQIGTTFANGAGNWSITSSLLADGVHSITATATDTAGNVSLPSPALSVTIDTLAPAVSTPDLNAGSDSLDPNATPLIGTNSDDITDHNTPSFSGTAEANALVRLYDGLTQIGTTFANGAGNWSITSSLLADGVHSITATATDTAGNVSLPSPALSVTIDTLAPAVSTPDLNAGSDSLDPNATPLIGTNSDDITDHNTPSFSGTAEANALVRLYDGLTQIGTTFANGAGNWSITSSLLADGVHSITATATDTAGNVSLPSPALSVTIDTLAPAVSTPDLNAGSDSLDPNATPLIGTNSDDITDHNTPSFSGTAEANALVRLYDGLTQIGTTFANGAGNWSITSSLLADGVHSITATATDTAGNVSLPSPALSVTIDTLAPAVSTPDLNAGSDSLDPNATPLIGTNSDDITDHNTPSFSGTAEANALVRLYDGLTQIGTTFANGAGNWSITSSLLADGVHSITATATDTAGNVSLPSPALSVTIDTLAPAVSTPDLNAGSDSLDPNATPLIGTNSDDITDHNTPSFSGTAEANALVRLYDGLTQIGTTFANGAGNWSITSSLLADGVHSITATATDTAGNVSLPSPALSVTIDTLAPAVSTPDLDAGSDTGNSSTDNITGNNTPSFSGTAEANALVRLYDGLTQIGTAFANGAGNWSIISSPLAIGVHSITATATDTAGNVSSLSASLSVTIEPTIDISGAADVNEGSLYTLSLGTITSPGAAQVTGYQISWGDGNFTSIIGLTESGWNSTIPHNITHTYADGHNPFTTYPITVTLYESVGGPFAESYPQPTLNVNVHNVAPTAVFFNGGAVNEGSAGLVQFTAPSDPSTVDTSSGFRYAYDLNNDGIFDVGDGTYLGSSSSSSQAVPAADLAAGPGSRTVRAWIIDADNSHTEYFTTITINNVAPTVNAGGDTSVGVNTLFTRMGSFIDPGADTWTATVDYDTSDMTPAVPLTLSGHNFTLSHTYTALGVYTVAVTVNDGNDSTTATFQVTVTATRFQVTNVATTSSGFDIQFNRAPDLSVLNLYDGRDASVDLPDLTVTGSAVGQVHGSVIWDAATNTAHWVKTGDPLAADTYTVSLRSASDAWKDTTGELLDGNFDNVAGGDYSHNFNVAAPASVVLSLPDFARGPGQAIDVPATSTGLPLRINNGSGVVGVDLTLTYDPTLLTIDTTIGPGHSQVGAGLPPGWSMEFNDSTPGHLVIAVYGTTALTPGPIRSSI